MANRLTKIKVREISLVDEPASPGAYIVLAKRLGAVGATDEGAVALYKQLCGEVLFEKNDVSSEPRDERGRWTAGGVAGTIASHLRQLRNHAAKLGASVAGAVRSGKLISVNPVTPQGVHFEFEHELPNGGGTIRSKVQILPKHMRNSQTMMNALDIARRALIAYGRPQQAQIDEVAGGLHISGAYSSAAAARPPFNGLGGTAVRQEGPGWNGSVAAANRTASSASQPTQQEVAAAQQGQPHPFNGFPINNVRGQKDGSITAPLNSPTIDYNNSSGHPYLTKDGDYIPGAPPDEQKIVHMALLTGQKLNIATPITSGGLAYKTEGMDVIPPGTVDRQRAWEQKYATYNAHIDSKAEMAAAAVTRIPEAPRETLPLLWPEASRTPVLKLFADAPKLFNKSRTVLFGKHGRENIQLFDQRHSARLFGKAFNSNEVRDALGRWSSSGRASMSPLVRGVKSIVTDLKQPSKQAGLATTTVAGIFGIPDWEAGHVQTAIEHAVSIAHAKISSDPRYMQFASKIGLAARKLFRKSRGKLTDEEHEELKGHMSRILSQMPFDRTIAGDHAALSAVCQEVHHRLYSGL